MRVYVGERQVNVGDGFSWRNVVLECGSGKISQKCGLLGSWIGWCQQLSSSGVKWFEKSNYLLFQVCLLVWKNISLNYFYDRLQFYIVYSYFCIVF